MWSLNYANRKQGTLDLPPTIGGFTNGRGEFYDMEVIDGKNVLVRNVWSDITATSARFEQAFSTDTGKTWEVNWIAINTRIDEGIPPKTVDQQAPPPDEPGEHDFDFNFGIWKTHQRRLLRPLTGSTTWVDYEGTDVIHPIWQGHATLGEIEADGAAGHLELLSLRLFNPQSHQWSFIVGTGGSGNLSPPMVGEFKNGRAEFIDQEPYGNKIVLIRITVSDITGDSCRFEQAFSADAGRTWETNFIVTETRLKDVGGDTQ